MVRESLNDWVLQCFERRFLQDTKLLAVGYQGSMAGQGYLFIEVLYAVLRHREWLEVPVFRALAVEFLQLDHGLPRSAAQVLVDGLISESWRLGVAKSRSVCVDDREFLNYCYVSAAGLRNDFEVEAELGLGSAIIRKLRDGVRVLDEARVDVFIPEYDAMLASIVIELGHQSKQCPWALDEHRLKYKMLAELGDQAQSWILEEQLPVILVSLLEIGLGVFDWQKSQPLCVVLERAKLLISIRGARGKVRGWDLTAEGTAVTAVLFKVRFGASLVSSAENFLGLKLTWQLALLNDQNVTSIEFIMELLSRHLVRMAPLAIETAVGRVVALGSQVLEPETVKFLLGAAKLPWHKAAVMRALLEVAPSDELAGVVADALSLDSTTSMMEAAGALLNRWGEVHTETLVEGSDSTLPRLTRAGERDRKVLSY
ncbi:MAG: hypothetical protein NTV34_20535 [Proteobacteria bacterium]|nr:hypothetical protein [Pseudomonadota bacterium]